MCVVVVQVFGLVESHILKFNIGEKRHTVGRKKSERRQEGRREGLRHLCRSTLNNVHRIGSSISLFSVSDLIRSPLTQVGQELILVDFVSPIPPHVTPPVDTRTSPVDQSIFMFCF